MWVRLGCVGINLTAVSNFISEWVHSQAHEDKRQFLNTPCIEWNKVFNSDGCMQVPGV